MMNDNRRDAFWETDLADLQKQYLPGGKTAADLPFAEMDWRVPVQGSPLMAMGRISNSAKNDGK
ncbi:MAG: hypothetical protein ACR2P4_05440 [Gammaproteobacteria bacterium]